MKKILLISLMTALLIGCLNLGQETIIDWANFVKFNDTTYTSNYSKELASAQYLGEVVSVVNFKLDENVKNSRTNQKMEMRHILKRAQKFMK